jgi:putative colanic acid biosynthesis UDP-glucose lipid carrier transferase
VVDEPREAGARGAPDLVALRPLPRTATGLIRPLHSKLALMLRAVDAGLCTGVLWLILRCFGVPMTPRYLVAAALAMLSFVLAAEVQDVYRAWRGASLAEELGRIVSAWAGTVVLLLFLVFATKQAYEFSRLATLSWLVATPLALCLWRVSLRVGLRTLRRHGRNTRSVAIAGAGDLGVRMLRTMLENAWMGLRPAGLFDDRKPRGFRPVEDAGVEVQGDLDELVRRARAEDFDVVYLALPLRAEQRMRQLLEGLADTTVSVYLVPDIFTFELLSARLVNFGGVPTFSIFENPFSGVDGWVKRVEDVVLATLMLALAAVPMLLIALAVKLSSRGPVIFRQTRYGLDGRQIGVWKFRTMSACEDGPEVTQATRGDPRVTRLGALLRRTSLDELPQLFNVLQGRMSVVGPRPHAVAHNELYRKLIHGYMLRHKVKPGITGWAQVNGFRGETETLEQMEKRVEHDLWYIRNWALWLDVKIVAVSAVKGFVSDRSY